MGKEVYLMHSLVSSRVLLLHAFKIRKKTYRRLISKREVKIADVEMAISALLTAEPEDTEEPKDRESAQCRSGLMY